MKAEKNIFIAFVLNLLFSVFELIGGIFTNSIAIITDAIHDAIDALSIGISFFLEKKSKKKPDSHYTYGYSRYSVLGALVTTSFLFVSSIIVIIHSLKRLINPVYVNYNGMILFALFGVIVNFLAAYVTRKGQSINQKAVNLHMIEDVLGWVIVLIGALIMKFIKITILDSVLSIIVAIYILINAIKNLNKVLDLFLEKIPSNVTVENIKNELKQVEGIIDVHHIHIWSIDGYTNCATMHIVVNKKIPHIKQHIREVLIYQNISHVTIEIENTDECCEQKECILESKEQTHHH